MDPAPGRDPEAAGAETPPAAEPAGAPRWFRALGRLVGFLLLAGPAVGILAALVLLPEYAAWRNQVYQRDLAAAQTADLESLKEAQERMIVAAYDDVVFIKRLAEWNLNLWPSNEQVLESRLPEPPAPGQVTGQPHPRPAPPDDPFLRAAARVSLPPDPDTAEYKERAGMRRGLFVVSAGLLLFAVLLFGPAPRRGLTSRQGPESGIGPARGAASQATD
jgi:hypothetical protein